MDRRPLILEKYNTKRLESGSLEIIIIFAHMFFATEV